MQSYVLLGTVSVLWAVVAYSLSFGGDIGGIIGNLDFVFLNGVGTAAKPGVDNIPHFAFMLRLEDFRGSWLVLFSHPADFTPVCASELIAFAGIAAPLRKLHCELLGLSVDSIFSHIAWLRALEEKFGVTVDYPLVADTAGDMPFKEGTEKGPSALPDQDQEKALFTDPNAPLGKGEDLLKQMF